MRIEPLQNTIELDMLVVTKNFSNLYYFGKMIPIQTPSILIYSYLRVWKLLQEKEGMFLEKNREEKVILVGCQLPADEDERFELSLEELASLTKTAQGEVVLTVTQKRPTFHPATYIGKGKLEELVAFAEELEPDVIIFNNELSPSQIHNLSTYFDARVIDRTQLILDIFAQRAKSREGKLQVELAQLQYALPRLVGEGQSLSRLGGGIGTRGPGETKLESDRRHIRRRITEIKGQLAVIVEHRERYRKRRKQNQAFQISIVGYTNAGKSTLFNRLTEANAFEEDLLFATLDPTTRRMQLPSGYTVLMTDTVGFIQDLPTSLVAAFRSTLEEAKEADFLLHVVDSSNADYVTHEDTVKKLLDELGIEKIPTLVLYNKKDKQLSSFVPSPNHENLSVSAFSEEDIFRVKEKIQQMMASQMKDYHVHIPQQAGKLLASIKQNTLLLTMTYLEDEEVYECIGKVFAESPLYHKMKEYRI